jgi:preprotein translocase subunit SecA
MLNRLIRFFGGDPNRREIERIAVLVDEINRLEADYEALSPDALAARTTEFRQRLALGETLDDLLVEAFAAVREASKRTIGLRHYDVQMIGGAVLHEGKIAEMRTGEGKTLVATLPLYLNGLSLNPDWMERAARRWGDDPRRWSFAPLDGLSVGRGAHLITVNDYLARRDARWMAPIYNLLGLSTGVLQMAARTENGKKAFLVDLQRESPHEDQHQLQMAPRREAYAADITYGTNSEFGFDYLRDNMAMRLDDRVQRGHSYAIVDEVDNVLIDEARTPLIISGPSHDDSEWYVRMSQVVRQLGPEDYEINERDRNVTLTEIGESRVESLLGVPLRDPDRPEDVNHEQARMLGYLEQGLRAQHLYRRNKEYLVQAGKIVIIDEFTGRLMPGRRWSDGLHQAVEAKEGVKVQAENITYATITIQNYFRMYDKLAGMTGTAMTESEEFSKIYKLDVLSIPTNLEYQAERADTPLVSIESKDQAGYKYTYYSRKDLPDKRPIFWKRKDYPDVVYRTKESKLRSIVQEILYNHTLGRPMLVGTTSVELSELISGRLRAEPLRRLAQVLVLRNAWFERNQREEDGRQVPELDFLNPPLDRLDIGEMRKLARQLEMPLPPEDPANLERLAAVLSLDAPDVPRLRACLLAGIPHQVLNARKHTEESQIIAGAGAFGAVTIATNMAGRGVDIKLGGDLAEEVIAAVARVLRRAGYADPYDMSLAARLEAVEKLTPEQIGIYESELNFFKQHMQDMERVRTLGGLHVIGSERHEARRIDNQLRGRAARQGDPGSSRFYLSMEDDLMRLFGGDQAQSLMARLRVDESIPLEMGLVGRLIEQSQTRVEGANFDTRKHLLEYDDVLNSQRARIYAQRNRIFSKDDLSEDVTEMLRDEINRRVPEALQDAEGPWRLLAWLEQIQPTRDIGTRIVPSFTLRLLEDEILRASQGPERLRAALVELVRLSLESERSHLLSAIERLLEQSQESLESQLNERRETLDNFFESLDEGEDDQEAPRPRTTRQVVEEASALVRLPVRLSREQERQAEREPETLRQAIRQQVEAALLATTIKRLLGAVERRMDEELELPQDELSAGDWNVLTGRVLDAVDQAYARRLERLVGQEDAPGSVVRDIDAVLERAGGQLSPEQLRTVLVQIPQGTRTVFDRRTHRRQVQRTTRLTYHYYTAQLLADIPEEEVTERVLEHLEQTQEDIAEDWGLAEITRLANVTPAELGEKAQAGLRLALGEQDYAQIEAQSLHVLDGGQRQAVVAELGRQALTEIYRELLLRVISELWIEYLTQVEALRVAIGLEAYGQRDPLVQYKGRASALFNELLDNIRLGVVARMFTFRPRDLSAAQAEVSRAEAAQPLPAGDSELPDEESVQEEPEEDQPAAAAQASRPEAGAPSRSASRRRRRKR